MNSKNIKIKSKDTIKDTETLHLVNPFQHTPLLKTKEPVIPFVIAFMFRLFFNSSPPFPLPLPFPPSPFSLIY